jgi:hypothetical protein
MMLVYMKVFTRILTLINYKNSWMELQYLKYLAHWVYFYKCIYMNVLNKIRSKQQPK